MDIPTRSTIVPKIASRRWSDLGTRAVSALVLVIVAIATARQGGTIFVLFWLIASIAILWEWQELVGGARPRLSFCLGSLALVPAAIVASRLDVNLALAILIASAGLMAWLAGPSKRAWAAGGMLYAGLLVVSVASLRLSFPFGARSIVWLFAIVWATDCFAYFGGRLIGGPKLWIRVSPSKTWAGTLIGLFAGSAIGTFVALRDLPEPWAIGPIVALSFAAALLSQAGDAFESGIKRHFGVKDSSSLIPGHGGAMDRLDGFIVAAVFAFAVGVIRNVPSIASGLFYWA